MTFPVYQPDRPKISTLAKTLRKTMTDPEKRLWWALQHRLPDYKFRRQVVIGRFIVDFCELQERLVVEVDGNQHGTDEARRYDQARTAFLGSQRFRVIRFCNEYVSRSMDTILDTILAVLIREPGPEQQAEATAPRAGEGKRHG